MNVGRHRCVRRFAQPVPSRVAMANPYASLTERLETIRHDVPNRFT